MKGLENRDPFKLGVLAVVVGLLLAVGVVVLSELSFGKATYTALFEQSAGLKAAEDVQIAGVLVGQVKSVALDGDVVKVTFTVNSSVHLGSQTTADIKVATLLGTHLLVVTPQGSGVLTNHQIPESQTSVPFNLQDVLNEGTQTLRQINAKQLASLLNTMTNELSPSSADVGPALQGVVRLSTAVSNRSGQIGDLLKAAHKVTDQLSNSSADLVSLMQQANLVIEEVTSRRQDIDALLVETSRLASNVNGLIADTRADTGPALTALNGTLAQLRAQDKTLRSVLDTMAPTARYLANAAGEGPWVSVYTHGSVLPPNDGLGCSAQKVVTC